MGGACSRMRTLAPERRSEAQAPTVVHAAGVAVTSWSNENSRRLVRGEPARRVGCLRRRRRPTSRYFVTWDGQLRVVDADSGMLLRSIPVGTQVGIYDPAAEGFPNGSTSGPVISNGRIYAGYGWTWGGNVAGGLVILSAE